MAYITNVIKQSEGDTIFINDSHKLKELILNGNTYQYTTTGKNLLPISIASGTTKNGLTITKNDNGDYVLNGTSTANTTWDLYTGESVTIPAGTYTGSIVGRTNIVDGYIRLNSGSYQTIFTSSSDSNTFTISSSFTFNRFYIYISSGKTFNNQVIRPMLETGSSATSFEPYTNGASPNLSYPQTVETVTGRQEIDVIGKNLINDTLKASATNNVYVGASSTTTTFPLNAGTYTISTNVSCTIQVLNSSSVIHTSSSNVSSFTFTLANDTNIRVRLQKQGITSADVEWVQLELGNQQTTYEEYKCNTYEINLGKNLFDKDNVVVLNANLSNSKINSSANERVAIIKCEPNTTYTFSKVIPSSYIRNTIATTSSYPELNMTVENAVYSATSPKTYTTNANAKYIVWLYWSSSDPTYTEQQTKDSMQIEKGSQATSYSAYKTPIELCKIGNYQDFIRKGTGKNLFNYTTATFSSPSRVNMQFENNVITMTTTGNYTSNDLFFRTKIPDEYLENGASYTLSSINVSGVAQSLKLQLRNKDTTNAGKTASDTVVFDDTYSLFIVGNIFATSSSTSIPSGTVAKICNVQVEKSNQTTEYEPYGFKDKWYLYKTIGKSVLNGSEGWAKHGNTTNNIHTYYRYISNMFKSRTQLAYSDYFYYLAGCWGVSNKAEGQFSGETNGAFYFNSSINNLADFKTWLGTHNTTVYYVLATPTATEITDTELINQLDLIKLQFGINNIIVDSNNLLSPIKLEYYSTENPYLDVIYSQQEKNDLKIWFDNVELQDASRYCESITRTARILADDGEKRFSLDNFYSTNLTVILHNVDLSTIKDQVRIEIGTDLGNNEYKYIPLGIFNIQDSPEINKNKITLKLRDNRVKFEFNYDAQPLIESLGGTATKKQILNDICEQAGVVNTINSFANEDDEVAIYDNTVEAQTYVSYLMEQAGLIPTINRYGQLIKIDLNDLYVWRIPLSLIEGWQKGEPYKIERVVYESGIIKYETDSDENLDTLYINSANPYIFSVAQVEGILNKLKDFEIDSVLTKKVLGNPAIDPYDIIEVYNDLDGTNDVVFRTLANTTYKFNGVHRDTFETQIGKESRTENVTKNSSNDNFKRIFTNINQLEGKIELNATETAKNTALINNQGEQIDSLGTIVTQSVENITAQVTGIQSEIDNGVNLVRTTSVIIDDEGLTVSTDTSKTTTTMTSDKFVVRSGGKDLAYLGYDETTNSTKAEMDNLTVTNYFVAGYHRIEKFERNGERRTGHFYIG